MPLLVSRFYNKINLLWYIHSSFIKINLLLNKLADLHNVTGKWDWHNSNLERQLFHCQATAVIGTEPIWEGELPPPIVPCWLRPWSWGLSLSIVFPTLSLISLNGRYAYGQENEPRETIIMISDNYCRMIYRMLTRMLYTPIHVSFAPTLIRRMQKGS